MNKSIKIIDKNGEINFFKSMPNTISLCTDCKDAVLYFDSRFNIRVFSFDGDITQYRDIHSLKIFIQNLIMNDVISFFESIKKEDKGIVTLDFIERDKLYNKEIKRYIESVIKAKTIKTKDLQEIQKIASEVLANVNAKYPDTEISQIIDNKLSQAGIIKTQAKSTNTSKDKEKLGNPKYFLLHNDITKARLNVNSKQEHLKGLFYFVRIESRRVENIVYDTNFIRKETCISGFKSILKENRILNIGVLKNIFRRNKSLLAKSSVKGYSLLSVKDYEKKAKELGKKPYYNIIDSNVWRNLETSLKFATGGCFHADRFIDFSIKEQTISELARLSNTCSRDEKVYFVYKGKKWFLKVRESLFEIYAKNKAFLDEKDVKGKKINLYCFAGLSGSHTLRVVRDYAFINVGDSTNRSIVYFRVRK